MDGLLYIDMLDNVTFESWTQACISNNVLNSVCKFQSGILDRIVGNFVRCKILPVLEIDMTRTTFIINDILFIYVKNNILSVFHIDN